ncbi:hypothetical protein HJC23_008343 [Cyclotella cryptica]|uniref:Uncharacterized protein n=1 Tax=Cyclotella cryptica TaxID=29204 RepID=A0ABD3Q4V6_9STRA|eukprot:CCRYP_008618-RA/>CCRYP_008618-RA protein AED:0.28 eAED:0.28 QI:0/-1/0/1/-1/1/1/0/556
MKVLPSLLRKGKGPVFLKPRGGANEVDSGKRQRILNQKSSSRDDGSFPVFSTAVADSKSDILIPDDPHSSSYENDPYPRSLHELSTSVPNHDGIRKITSTNLPSPSSILPSISYPPFSDEPCDDAIPRPATPTATFNVNRINSFDVSPERRDHMWYKNQMYLLQKEQQEMRSRENFYQGLKKHFDDDDEEGHHPWRSNPRKYYESMDRPAGSFDCYDDKTPSPVGVDEFESLTKFQSLKRDISIVAAKKGHRSHGRSMKESVSSSLYDDDTQTRQSSTAFDDITALEDLTKDGEGVDIFSDDDDCTEDDTCDMEFSRDEEDVSAYLFPDGILNYTSTCKKSTLDAATKEKDDRTELFSDCEYDAVEDTTCKLAMMDETSMKRDDGTENGDCDTVDESATQGHHYSQCNDEESLTSSYLFELVDDGSNLLNPKRHRKGKKRPTRKSRDEALHAPVSDTSVASNTINLNKGKHSSPPKKNDENLYEDADSYAGCPCLLSFTKMKEDAKSSYTEATKALNQVMYAFFVIEDDVNAMADKIRGVKFRDQAKCMSSGPCKN